MLVSMRVFRGLSPPSCRFGNPFGPRFKSIPCCSGRTSFGWEIGARPRWSGCATPPAAAGAVTSALDPIDCLSLPGGSRDGRFAMGSVGMLEVVIASACFLFFLPNNRPSKPPAFEGLSVALDGSAEGVFREVTFVSSLPAFMSREEVDDPALPFICCSRGGKGGAWSLRPSGFAPTGRGGCLTSLGACCPRISRESEGG